jgi:hypothetical protein
MLKNKLEKSPDKEISENLKSDMSLQDYIPTKTLQALCRHTIANGFAMGCFALTGTIASRVFPDETIKTIIHSIEYIGIALILGFLLIEFFREIIRGKNNGKNSGQ